jgi:hypothetical protein
MPTTSIPYLSIPTRKPTSPPTIYALTSGTSASAIRVLVSLYHPDLEKTLMTDRYRGYQTCEYGRTHRSDHRSGISPPAMQPFHVLELKKQYQARRYARLCTVRSSCKMCVPHLNLKTLCPLTSNHVQASKKKRTQHPDPSSPRSSLLYLMSSLVTTGGISCRATISPLRSGTLTWSHVL